jgi:ABC-2 type transport system permease protein
VWRDEAAGRLLRVGIISVAALGLLAGCASPITDQRVAQAVSTSFSHLYALHQTARQLPFDAATLGTESVCDRSGAPGPSGPGDDWTCNITWRTAAATTGAATYSLNVRADGCYSADGDGPVDLNGSATLVDADGHTVVNPLWAFDGCFPLT